MFTGPHGHVKVMCSCGRVISQCRCLTPEKKTIETRKADCSSCKKDRSRALPIKEKKVEDDKITTITKLDS